MKARIQVDGQQGRQDIKGEKQQEIAKHRLAIIGIPQTGSVHHLFNILFCPANLLFSADKSKRNGSNLVHHEEKTAVFPFFIRNYYFNSEIMRLFAPEFEKKHIRNLKKHIYMKNHFMAALMLAGALCSCGGGKQQDEYVHSVALTTPVAGEDVSAKSYSGTVYEAHEISLGFKTPGQLKKILVKEGDRVRRGQLMASLDDADYKLGVEALQIQYDQLQQEVERTRQLFEKKSVSPNDYEKAVAGLRQLGVQLQVNKNKLEYTHLYAPTDGVVQSVNFSPAEMVDAGTPVFTLLDVSHMEVEVNIPVAEYNRREHFTGFTCTANGHSYPMQRLSLTPRADGNQLYQLRLLFASAPGSEITSGMNVDVHISASGEGSAATASFTLPPCAVFQQEGTDRVWVFNEKDSTVTARKVTLGGLDAQGKVNVTDGLTGTERVVRAGVSALHEGQHVKVVTEPAETNVGGLM
jgi:RND family efflux transporter MFP subunit